MRILSLALFVCVLTAVPAQAQIYTWRDAAGHLVLSNKPRGDAGGQVATYSGPGTSLRAASRPQVSERAVPFEDLIAHHATTFNIAPELVRAVIQAESAFNPRAVSPKGAMGLMQLMPATARELGVENPFEPADNIRGGVTYLARLLARYDQNVELALAAYNAGPGSVDKYDAVPPYRETRAYVKKITAATQAAAPPPPRAGTIYKWTEMVGGQPKLRFTTWAPKDVPYEVAGKR